MTARLLTTLLALFMALLPVSAMADDDNDIDLKLFGDNVIEGWEGCRFGLWQHNRDPGQDRFAYVFFAPIPDGEALPAWVKIGDDVQEVSQVETGAPDTGMLPPLSLYRDPDGKLTIVMEIMDQARSDRGIEIADGRLTFLRNDKFPFAIRVKGLNGCPGIAAAETAQAPASPDTGLILGPPIDYDSLDRVPRAVLRAIASEAAECEPANTAGLSSAYAVSDTITLWQVPCNLYAYQGSSVFALTWAGYPDHATVLFFPAPPGLGTNDHAELINADVDPRTATVTSVSLDSGGDCGTYERFELVDAEGETLEFTLREYREKTNCDGVEQDPATFPLVYNNR